MNPRLRIGVISDSQCNPSRNDWGVHNLEKALRVIATKRPDVLAVVGDVADYGDDTRPLEIYRQLVLEHFPQERPVQVVCAGNHDLWGHEGQPEQQLFDDFCAAMGEPNDNPSVKTVNGFTFIALTEFNSSGYTQELCEKLRKALADATSAAPGRPVFVLTHKNPAGTVTGGHGKEGIPQLRAVLNQFPEVVSLSGHTHASLYDERAIWQGEFTALNTSCLAYGCTEERVVNDCNGIVPFSREVVDFLFIDVFADHIDFHRFNAEDACEIKPDALWTMTWPYSPDQAKYSREARAATRRPPQFPPDDRILLWYDYGFVYFIFQAAEHDDFTHFYQVAITDLETGETKTYPYIADFYRLRANRDPRVVLKAPQDAMVQKHPYRIQIFPQESFGKTGEPLALDIVTPRYTFRKTDIYPQQ